MTFGEVGKEGETVREVLCTKRLTAILFTGTRVHDVEAVKVILDVFQKHGHYEVSMAAHMLATAGFLC